MSSPRRIRTRVVALVVLGLTIVAVVAGIALAHEKAAPIGSGVVVIRTDLRYQGGEAAGTGMVVTSAGEVLTNNHVISGATAITVSVPSTGRTYTARVVGYDVSDDVALLQLQHASNLKTVKGSARLVLGATVTAVGNARGSGTLSTATGRVTGLGRSITARDGQGSAERLTGLIETDAAVEPGDSGGALVNGSGRVIGMITAASAQGFGFQQASSGDAYAIPIAKALRIAHKIASGKASARIHIGATAWLGVEIRSVDASSGLLVAGVVPGGPAASAGLAPGELITAVDGRAVSSPRALSSLLLTKNPGARIAVRYVDQAGRSHTASVRLGSGPPK